LPFLKQHIAKFGLFNFSGPGNPGMEQKFGFLKLKIGNFSSLDLYFGSFGLAYFTSLNQAQQNFRTKFSFGNWVLVKNNCLFRPFLSFENS